MTQDSFDNYEPLKTYFVPDASFSQQGQKVVGQGKVGVIVLAGGHGSRLGFDAPKGCFVINGKSLYQRLAQKVALASTLYAKSLHLAIMTSDATHEKTIEHFDESNYFGLKKEQVLFFQQQNLPLQDESGNVVSLEAPDGNGALFWHFAKSGHLAAWQEAGIEHVIVFPVDNVLADPFEPNLIGLHDLHENDVTVVGVKRETAQEQVGVLVNIGAKLAVVEYSEMADSERLACDVLGSLKYPLANISYFAFSLEFIRKVLTFTPSDLPLHKAKKKVRTGDKEAYYYKSEYFIFDLLDFSDKAEVLLLSRDAFFAPLKNKTGPQSIATVEAALRLHEK